MKDIDQIIKQTIDQIKRDEKLIAGSEKLRSQLNKIMNREHN